MDIWHDKYKEHFNISMIYTLIFSLCAHGYRYFNLFNSHDAMLTIVQDDVYWQRSIGRFMQPLVMVLRGAICAPWLICFGAIFFLGLSVFLICVIFQIEDKRMIALLAGIMTCNIVLTTSYAAYLPWVDIYAIALFLSLLGVWCCIQKTWVVNACGCILMALSMGFYQAYICVAIGVLMILSLCILLEDSEWKSVCKKIGRFVLCLVTAGVVYYLLYQGVCILHHVQLADTYNGLKDIGEFSNVSIGQLIVGAYKEFFWFLRFHHTFASIILLNIKMMDAWEVLLFVVNIFVCIVIVIGIIRYNILKKSKWWSFFLQLLIMMLFPLGVNAVYVISKGVEHVLMVYSFVLIYVWAMVVVKKNIAHSQAQKCPIMKSVLLMIPLFLVIWNNVVFSNQIYYKLHLQQEALQSMMTKILYEIEHVEEYEYGVTPVAFVGNFTDADYLLHPEYFNEISVMGVGSSPLTYGSVENSYIKFFVNNKINIVNVNIDSKEIESLPNYPDKGSIAFWNGMILVKISD